MGAMQRESNQEHTYHLWVAQDVYASSVCSETVRSMCLELSRKHTILNALQFWAFQLSISKQFLETVVFIVFAFSRAFNSTFTDVTTMSLAATNIQPNDIIFVLCTSVEQISGIFQASFGKVLWLCSICTILSGIFEDFVTVGIV